ncbi:unnamed protein product [Adineta steineri]|uniref:Uncharacterized protein n=1 Tax=Adineta steineri TaxID=433720 RepID=A0A819I6Y6_9BILA|nr:unnamed protein product [Adineta steineri]
MTSSSYLLDREILGSTRNIIDAHSNAPFSQHNSYRGSYGTTSPLPYTTTTTSYHHHSYGNGSNDVSETKKVVIDFQDQIRLLKSDLEKKDALIQELTSIKDPNKHENFEASKYEALVGQERSAFEGAKRELDQYRTKIEGLTYDLRETTLKLAAKDERINELKHEIDSIKREYDLINQANNQLHIRIRELETNVNSYDSVSNKSSLTILTLQKDGKEKQEQILELQSRVRTHIEEREASERKTEALQRKLQELFSQLKITVTGDFAQPTPASFDILITKITEICAENTTLRGTIVKLEDTGRSFDNETKANRATIQQMVNQLHVYEQNTVSHHLELDKMKAERDTALSEKEAVKVELETIKARLDSVQKAWQNTRGELDARETKYTSHESHVKQLENDLLYARTCFDTFKQQVGQLLSDNYVKVEPKEDEIKEKIHLLMQSSKDRGVIITNLQNQKEQISKQLQEQIDLNKDIEKKHRHTESHALELEHRVKSLDNDYTTTEVYRENLKQDKVKFLHFLERLGSIMKIENVSNELGYELNPDVLLTRAEQLMKLERDSIVDQKTSIYNLQRKMKQMKEQMENKDLHLDLLRKKVIALEEGRAAKTDLEREIDDHVMLSRKMKVKVDHLTQHVHDLKHENIQLKAQITDIQTLKNRINEQEKEIRRLLDDVNKLQNSRDKQAVKISTLQDKIHSVDDEANRTLLTSDNAVRNLSNEVRFLKSSLEQITEREHRLLDFRSLIAHMLGLDSKSLSIPDYEITARLERLLAIIQPSVAIPMIPITSSTTTTSTNHIHHQQQQQQQSPYHHHHHHHQNIQSAHTRHRSPSPGSHRARSLSPLHVGIDPRTY